MHPLASIIEIQMVNERFKASVRRRDIRPNRWATLGRCEGVGGGGGALKGHRAYQWPYLDSGVCWKREGVNNGPAAIKWGVSVLRLNEQADKLCEGSRGGGRLCCLWHIKLSRSAGHQPV